MPITPDPLPFHVHAQDSERIAALKTPEDAAMLIGCLGNGYSISYEDKTVWREGQESQPASESYDFVAETVYDRIPEHRMPALR